MATPSMDEVEVIFSSPACLVSAASLLFTGMFSSVELSAFKHWARLRKAAIPTAWISGVAAALVMTSRDWARASQRNNVAESVAGVGDDFAGGGCFDCSFFSPVGTAYSFRPVPVVVRPGSGFWIDLSLPLKGGDPRPPS